MPRPVVSAAAFPLDDFAIQKARREHMRWLSLCGLDAQRPEKMTDSALLELIRTVYPDATLEELRRHLDYLADHQLLALTDSVGCWQAKLKFQGVDIVEYTVPCPAGVSRPGRP